MKHCADHKICKEKQKKNHTKRAKFLRFSLSEWLLGALTECWSPDVINYAFIYLNIWPDSDDKSAKSKLDTQIFGIPFLEHYRFVLSGLCIRISALHFKSQIIAIRFKCIRNWYVHLANAASIRAETAAMCCGECIVSHNTTIPVRCASDSVLLTPFKLSHLSVVQIVLIYL